LKIEIELDDQLVKKIEKEFEVDMAVVIQEFASVILKGLVEVELMIEAGMRISDEVINKYGKEIGHKIFERAKKEDHT